MPHPETASFAQFADIGGFKRSYVTALRKAGRLVLTEDKRAVRVPESLQLIRETADPSKAGVAQRHAANRAAKAAKADPAPVEAAAPPQAAMEADEDLAPNPGDLHSLRRAKAMADKEEALADAAIRANQKALGQLYECKDVDGVIATAGTTFRKNVERFAADLAPKVAPITDESAVRSILSDAYEEALRELSRQFAALAKAAAQ
jgi:hypothetical protein